MILLFKENSEWAEVHWVLKHLEEARGEGGDDD